MITVNKTKLQDIIGQLVYETCRETGDGSIEGSATIGESKGCKIILTVSRDEDEDHPELDDRWQCVDGDPVE